MADGPDAMHAYYALDKERDRLTRDVGRVEYERTVEVVSRTLPPVPAVVADIGGGPGRYTDWLATSGYTVIHRDVMAHHVEHVVNRHGDVVDAAVGDARELDLDDGVADVVLLLGPLYHLPDEEDRLKALREAVRVTRPGGVVHVAAISRWAARLHGMLVSRIHQVYPVLSEMIEEMEGSGWMRPIVDAGFTGFAHTPEQLRDEVVTSGLDVESLVALEGISFALADLEERLDDERERALLMDTLRAVESVPELLGLGPHLLATARAPVDPREA